MQPVYIFENVREAEWWTRRRPQWKCCSWWNVTGQRSDRIVVVKPMDCRGHEFILRFHRVIANARARLVPGGRLLVVDWRGIPEECFRNKP